MRKFLLTAGMLALVSAGVACDDSQSEGIATIESAARPGETLVVSAEPPGDDDTSCMNPEACFRVDSSFHNITHLFIDFDKSCIEHRSEVTLTVFEDGGRTRVYTGRDFHTRGGPCGSISRVIWTPLQGKQQNVLACVSFGGDEVPEGVQLGAKASNLCAEDGEAVEGCDECNGEGGKGGEGGHGGAGGAGGTGGKPPKKDHSGDDCL